MPIKTTTTRGVQQVSADGQNRFDLVNIYDGGIIFLSSATMNRAEAKEFVKQFAALLEEME